jgi:hypothetical protein
VLVIIGLIAGSVLVGRDLIRAAQVRSVISDVEKYKTAAMTFMGKYNCLPGDCLNATAFFGASTNCGLWAPLAPGTCNGNGNGTIEWQGGEGAPLGPTPSYAGHSSEDVLFWQQLSLDHMIEGSYSGFNGSAGWSYVQSDNGVPFSSKEPGNCYGIVYSEYDSTGSRIAGYKVGNNFEFGFSGTPSVSQGCSQGGLAPIQAQSIDSKIDDGMPFTGNITTWYNTNTCTLGVLSSSTWNPANSAPVCALIFSAGF